MREKLVLTIFFMLITVLTAIADNPPAQADVDKQSTESVPIEPAASDSIGATTPSSPKSAPILDSVMAPIDLVEPFRSRRIETEVKYPTPTYRIAPGSENVVIDSYEIPPPKKLKTRSLPVTLKLGDQRVQVEPDTPPVIQATQSTIEAGDFDTNVANTGSVFIPADPHAAAGPNHVVNVFNTSIQFFQKNGTLDFDMSLASFFAGVSPVNATFDPKVLYDQFSDRWYVVTLERRDIAAGDPVNTSRVLVAVSDDSDPNGAWTVAAVDSSDVIGGIDRWLDYPGFAVDEEAVYITGNMFSFLNLGGAFCCVRMIVFDKGLTAASILDPYGGGGVATTTQPAHIYGTAPAGVGTWLISYSGLSGGGNEAFQTVRIDNPLTAPTFTQAFTFIGDIEDTSMAIPDAPQMGGGTPIDSGDRRALDAVWRSNELFFTAETLPPSGPDIGQATVLFSSMNTLPAAPTVNFLGTVGGEQIAMGTVHTSYGSIAVNADGGMVIGFSASSADMFPSSYYVTASPSDSGGSTRSPILIRSGLASYVRTFGSANRWGDYSSAAVDPDDTCFWIYNKYAITTGTLTQIPGSMPPVFEDGRWGTAYAHFCNDAPVGNDDTATVAQGGTVSTVNGGDNMVTDNDTDADTDDTLTVNTTPVSGPSNAAAFTLNANGTFSYTHDGTITPTDNFVYQVCDDGSPSACDTATVNISVSGINNPPVAGDDSFTVDEGATATTLDGGSDTVLNNDTDVDDVNLTATLTGGPANAAAFNLNMDGTFSYQHDGSETTMDSFTYDVCDDEMPTPACDSGTVTITITPVNDPPVAGNDSFTLAEGATATMLDGGSNTVLNNDSDIDDMAAVLTAAVNTGPANAASFTLNGDGTFSYQHDGSEGNMDSFTYDVCDDDMPTPACDTGTVTITITPVNDAPVAGDDSFTVDEGAMASLLDGGSDTVLNNDSDADDMAAMLTATLNTGPANAASFTLNGDGTFSYQHDGSETTMDSFTYDVCDDDMPTPACDTGTVTITITPVNDAPVAGDDSFTVDEGAMASMLDGGSDTVLNNDSDADDMAAMLTATLNNGPANAASFTLNGDGTFSYQHDGSETTMDSFTYDVCDDDMPTPACDTGTVTITITPVNDAPVAGDDSFTVDEGAMASMLDGGSDTVLNNDSDADDMAAMLTATLNTGPANAASFTLNGDGTFSYQHDGSETTMDSFTYDVCDDDMPTPACDTGTVTITITPVNDAPVAGDDSFTVDEGAMASLLDGGSDTVLNNDSDADDMAAMLTATLNTGPANAASFTLNGDGTFSYQHDGSETTMDSFTYDVCDDDMPTPACDTGTVTITITPVNDAPVAGDDSFTVDEGAMASMLDGGSDTVLNNDSDADDMAAMLTATLNTGPANAASFTLNGDGTFSYQHDGSETTMDSFTYDVCDDDMPTPACDTGTVTITITPVNDAPVAGDDSFTVDEGAMASMLDGGSDTVLNNDSDADDMAAMLTATLNTGPANAASFTLNGDGTFSYQHDGSETTMDSFTYDVCDDDMPTPACDTGTVTITITPVNDAPVAGDDSFDVDEGGTANTLNRGNMSLLDNDNDPDDANLTAVINTPPVNATSFTLNPDGTFSYTHDGTETTMDSFTYDACDDELPVPACDTATVTITVNPVNDPPMAVDDSATVDEGGTVTMLDGGSVSVLDGDTDPDSFSFTVTLDTDVSNGTLNLLMTGEFSYTHNDGETTSDSFTYEVCDDGMPTPLCDIGMVSITVNPVNDAPMANTDTATVVMGGTVTTVNGGDSSLLLNDTDAENDNLVMNTVPVTPPVNGNLTLNMDGTFSYMHDGSGSPSDFFEYEVCDDGMPIECDTGTVNITILLTDEIFEDGFED